MGRRVQQAWSERHHTARQTRTLPSFCRLVFAYAQVFEIIWVAKLSWHCRTDACSFGLPMCLAAVNCSCYSAFGIFDASCFNFCWASAADVSTLTSTSFSLCKATNVTCMNSLALQCGFKRWSSETWWNRALWWWAVLSLKSPWWVCIHIYTSEIQTIDSGSVQQVFQDR